MNLILLAAGRGSRLEDYSKDMPKCLLEVSGETLLSRIYEMSKNFNFEKVIVIGGYMSSLLKSNKWDLLINHSWAETGPFETLVQAAKYLESDDCVISYTDIFYSSDFLGECYSSIYDIYVPSNLNWIKSWQVRSIDILSDLESFRYGNGEILEIGQKVADLNQVQGQFSGLIKTTPSGWEKIRAVYVEQNDKKADFTSVLSKSITKGISIRTSPVDGFWYEFDTMDDVVNYHKSRQL
jgi:choline kinase